jgi:hypothetical protein
MNRKQFALVLFALAIVGSAGLLLINGNRQSWTVHEAKIGEKLLPHFAYNDVETIHVKSCTSDFQVRRKDGVWRIPESADYPANYSQIKDLLLRIRELKILQSDRVGPSQLGRVGLELPTVPVGPDETAGGKQSLAPSSSRCGTLVEFKNAEGKVMDGLLVGKRHLRPQSQTDPFRLRGLFDGCYVRLPSMASEVLLISDDLAAIAPDRQAWLSRSFVKMDNLKSVSLGSSNGVNLWTLLRSSETQPWSLADANVAEGEVLDSTAASKVIELLPFLTFIDVQGSSDMAKASRQDSMVLFVETFDQFFYTVKIAGPGSAGNYLLSIATRANIPADKENAKELEEKLVKEQGLSPWIYVAEAATVQPVLCSRSELLGKKIASR